MIEWRLAIAYSLLLACLCPAGYAQMEQGSPLTPGTVFRDRLADGGQGPAMVVIPGGTFQMGSPPSEAGRGEYERQHQAAVAPFLLGQTEVSFAEYDRFARATGRELPDDERWGRESLPVINVSWVNAMAYAEWLSAQTGRRYRLPTEVEWEYAARAGTHSVRWWGDEIGRNHANCAGCGSRWDHRQTAPVGSFRANLFGLYDMLGNVWEWSCSNFDRRYQGDESRCSQLGDQYVRATRGGAWRFGPDWVRSASRNANPALAENPYIGFRVAGELE